MALTRTTSSAITATDTEVVLASITGLQVSNNIAVDAEVMRVLSVPSAATLPVGVLRGTRGTGVAAHAVGSQVTFGPASDFSAAGHRQGRDIVSYAAAGAIANPVPGTDRVAVILGTTALAMTLANPSKDNDADLLIIVSGGKGAHTVTYTTTGIGGGAGATDLATFSTVAQMSLVFVAFNELWILLGGASGAGAVAAAPVIT
jgi:hypothetical protein